jgi:putative thioredoxin
MSLLTDPATSPRGAATAVVDVTQETFRAEVLEASMAQVVLVDFWAEWCGPCKALTPVLERIVQASGGKVKLAKINVDKNQALAAQFRVQSIPLVYAFVGGRPADAFQGAQPESVVQQFVGRLVKLLAPSEDELAIEDVLAAGLAALDAGDLEQAQGLFSAVLEAQPDSAAALAGLGKIALAQRDFEAAAGLIEGLPEALAKDPAIRQVAAAVTLARKCPLAPDRQALVNTLAATPNDHAARFALAQDGLARGDMEGGAATLLDLIARDRSWNEGAARALLLDVFEAMGLESEFTVSHRRKLSSILFS